MLNRRTVLTSAALLSSLGSRLVKAQQVGKDVVIGVIYPFTGSGAQLGVDARFALETASDLINQSFDLDLPLARDAGLPNLGGAKIRLVFADHQADPQKGRAEAERLITQDNVVALIGTYHSSVAAVVSQVAERYEVPFIAAESSSPSLHRKGLKYFFRPGPHDEMYSVAMFDFIEFVQKKYPGTGKKIALFYEDTLFGNDTSKVQKDLAQERNVEIVADVKYRASSPSLSSEVQLLKGKDPDIILATSYTTDAILLIRTMSELGFKHRGIISQNGGFIEPTFLSTVGSQADGIISRASFVLDLAASRPSLKAVNELYKRKSTKDLNDNTAREFMALLVLADAINRAGDTKGPAIEAALRSTNIPGSSTIMPWDRVSFGPDGQNTSIRPVMMQYGDGEYRTVWPENVATRPLKWPVG